MTPEDKDIETIDDLDKPVDETLLMGEDDEAEQEEDIDTEDLKKIAEAAEEEKAAEKDPEDGADVDTEDKEEKHEAKSVPLERFNQVYAEMKQLKEQVAALSGKEEPKEAEKPVDIKALRDQEATIEDQLEEAMLNGDSDKTKELRANLRELRGKMDDLVLSEAETRAEQRIERKREVSDFQSMAAALEAKYPVLNPETGDPDAIALVVDLRDAYIAKGMPMVQALQTAAEKIAPRFAKAEEKAAEKGDEKPDPRNVTAITRGAKDSNRIPPADGGVGNRAMSQKDANDIPQKDWEKLSQEERDKILAA